MEGAICCRRGLLRGQWELCSKSTAFTTKGHALERRLGGGGGIGLVGFAFLGSGCDWIYLGIRHLTDQVSHWFDMWEEEEG